MAATKPVYSIWNHVGKHRPALDIEISGNWNLHHGRRNRTTNLFYVNSLVLVSCLMLMCCAFMLLNNVNATESCTVHMQLRMKALEDRITVLEESRNEVKQMDNKMERRKRSVENVRAIQFISSNPSLFAARPLEGVIGPWNEQSINKMDSFGIKLVESDRKLEIGRAGTYYIYSQVTYPSKNNVNSYSINVISDDKVNTAISVCSSAGNQVSGSEVSCYTSTLRSLRSGDIIYLQQMEQNRDINFDISSTYFGVILLSE